MISVVRLLLLAQLWHISPVSSSEGLIRGDDGRTDEVADVAPSWDNSTDTAINYHHRAGRTSAGLIEQRIIGGSGAAPRRYSYTVGLTDKGGLYCGGVLICKDMVLTAAHCGDGKEYVRFLVGTSKISDGFSNRAGEFVFPERGWIHPNFKWATMDNDVMVYMLDREVKTDVEVVTLNDDSRVPSRAGDRLVALGWGDTNPGSPYQASDSLLKVGVGYIPNKACKERTGVVGSDFVSFQKPVRDSMLCALDKGKDGCQGDSGGPLIEEGSDQRGRNDVLMGLSSWGVACAHNTLPGVYTRVSSQYTWIKSIVCKNSRDPPASFNCGGGKDDNSNNGNNNNNNNSKPNNNNNNSNSKPNNNNSKKKKKQRRKRRKKKKKNNNKKNVQRTRRRNELFV
mmetsp:Transcript_18437/g.39877  ORF Transcript_18437/g.39877 Transcript_18437/m.39877 type:complete len:396 (+) Transcript_18437:177-1364(+)|eukprot:CAMPEP_0172312798 /NCGR_PEP_ID=MMETSP1058-20130122/18565_1 /TAXON_ID=83371 /ORGANISM="Detonula confervacea, Strain CCMP 353" /LENGTH=395 /DNA_ID=CAMNT_0013026343 /DNA_START=108 /DNA_END=1295 /DNA_ORIENTATION=+